MTPRANMVLWLIATVAVAALTAWTLTHRLPKTPVPVEPSALSLHEWMHRQLNISAAQHAALEPLESAYEKERLRLYHAVQHSTRELALAMRDSAPDATILSIQTRLNTAQGDLQRATLRHFMEMKKHLNQKQAEELALWTHDSLLNPAN